jgi:hypothetical protein
MANLLEIGADEDVSEFFEPYIQSGNLNFIVGSGASLPAIPTMGNLEAELDALLLTNGEEEADKRCVEFIEQIDGVHAQVTAGGAHPNIEAVVTNYRGFLTAIDRILFTRKSTLLPRQATIFSTNYDLFLEHASSFVPAVILNDGFDRSSSLNSEFKFTPERYFDRTYRSGPVYSHHTEIPTINLVKLHGSLSWRRNAGDIVFGTRPLPALSAEDKNNAATVRAYLERHFLILPNLQKHHTTLMERVYYDLLRLFSKALDYENTVLISFGFSFADEHILDITRRALRNPTSQLIVISYDQASAAAYQAKFTEQRNVAVVAPVQGAVIDFPRFTTILNSILPNDVD